MFKEPIEPFIKQCTNEHLLLQRGVMFSCEPIFDCINVTCMKGVVKYQFIAAVYVLFQIASSSSHVRYRIKLFV